jgi:hypothetical protein
MLSRMRAALRALPIVVSLMVSCGGRTELPEKVPGKGYRASCPEPDTADPVAPPLMLSDGSSHHQFQVTLHNRCTDTIWPGMSRHGGLDQTEPDPSFWTSLWPDESRTVAFHFNSALEILLFGRTRCSFDDQGQGACETGDCGGFICSGSGNAARDATTLQFSDGEWGYLGGYNVPMLLTSPGCEARQCSFDLDACPAASRVVGACGLTACLDVCASAPECCGLTGCGVGADVEITFCP